jgi:hypothetical protein
MPIHTRITIIGENVEDAYKVFERTYKRNHLLGVYLVERNEVTNTSVYIFRHVD